MCSLLICTDISGMSRGNVDTKYPCLGNMDIFVTPLLMKYILKIYKDFS